MSDIQSELIGLAIQETPDIIAAFKAMFVKKNPDLPVPTEEEVMTAFETAYQSSRDKDEAWLAAHPE